MSSFKPLVPSTETTVPSWSSPKALFPLMRRGRPLYVSLGFVLHLNYKNPWLSPFDEFQRFKQHPSIRSVLEGGRRVAYGARAITEGGYQSVPKLTFPGGVLIGCSAGFVNVPRIKGSHNAMKTGMLAAEAAFAAISAGRAGDELAEYEEAYKASWVARELRLVRNVKPLWSKFGTLIGVALGGFDMWVNLLTGGFSFFGTLKHGKSDAASTGLAADYKPIVYPKPDGVISFDKLSSVFLSSTNHEEDQPAHLKLTDPTVPIAINLPEYGEPARLYCPAAVYEVLYDENGQNLTGTFADYLLPTAVESPKWELGKTITPSPHHPIGAKGVGESPTVGAPPAIANAVVDALWHLGVRHIDIPITPQKVWRLLREHGVTD